MKKFMDGVDRFCYRHPRFGIPNLMLYIVIGNVIVWLFSMMDSSGTLLSMLRFSPYHILHGQVWRLVTFALIPYNNGLFALISFYFYYFIGSNIERQWGSGRFNIYFFTGMALAVVYGFILYFALGGGNQQLVSLLIGNYVSAYYIYLSMFFVFATLWSDMQVLFLFFIPVKMKWLGLLDLALFVYDVARIPFPYDLLPVVAVLNYLIFCGGDLCASFRGRVPTRTQRKNTVNFRSEVRRIRHEQKTKPYTRHCEVCGRTDTEYPDLEFRYCSRCQGYHCFCIDHINNHRHFTE
ncbi:MAG: rhomboid family intramembrane serine protease [Oscillospiraceae bacterium]|nr:rhomboid family intramembrane serine protease [Oscillospiraceae bacterium]